MTTNKQLREQAESVMHWSSSLTAAWPSDPDFNDAWTVGTIDEDGNKYPVIEVDADQYDAPGDSERLARFFAAANPAAVLALLDSYEALQAECEKLREHLQNLIDQTTPLEPVPGNPMWSRRIQLDEVMAERDQLRAECDALVEALERFIGAWTDCQQYPVHAEEFEILTDICEDSMKALAAHRKGGKA